jgi:hypothetical protein
MANYSHSDQMLAKTDGIRFSFYLSHALKEPKFDDEWKIYFPQSLEQRDDVRLAHPEN